MTKKNKKNRSKPAGAADESSNAQENIENGVPVVAAEDQIDVGAREFSSVHSHQCSLDPLKDRVEVEKRLARENDLREEIQSLRDVMLLKDDLREEIRTLRDEMLAKDGGETQSLRNEALYKDELRREIQSLRSEMQSLLQKNELHEEVKNLRAEMKSLALKMEDLQSSFTSLQERNQAHSRSSELESHVSHQPLQVAAGSTCAEEESSAEDMKLQQAANALMLEKLVADNAELASKINKQIGVISQLTSGGSSSDKDVILSEAGMHCEGEGDPPGSSGALKTEEQVEGSVEQVGAAENDDSRPPAEVSGASKSDGEMQVVAETREKVVPFTDAPLMGAPFRAISFVARFVSGADLVNSGG